MAITPPSERIWWKEPVQKVEIVWVIVAFLWGLTMFFTMIWWHGFGQQNLSNEAYRIQPFQYAEKVDKMIAEHTVRQEGAFPVVKPPPGSDVYMIARLWKCWPILQLEKDQTYRLHLSSMDYNHGFSLQPANINIQIVPGYEHVVTVTPNQSGTYALVCNEYCGINHHTMASNIYVK